MGATLKAEVSLSTGQTQQVQKNCQVPNAALLPRFHPGPAPERCQRTLQACRPLHASQGAVGPRQLLSVPLLLSCCRLSLSSAAWSFPSQLVSVKMTGIHLSEVTRFSFSDVTLLLQSRRDSVQGSSTFQNTALLSNGTLHLPTGWIGAEASGQASSVAATHGNRVLPRYQFCYIRQHSNSKPELQFQYTTPAEP